ncbi:MAG: hypothetical protein AABW48_01705 [Nanoarchaeota archaeon]
MINKLKKFGAVLVLALFLLSILPVALAEKDSNEGNKKGQVIGSAVNDNDQESNVDKLVSVAQKAEKGLQAAKQQIRDAQEDYPKLKENFQEVKRVQKEQREQVAKLDKDAKKCDSQTEECKKVKSELKLGVKNHLQKTSDVVNRALDKLANRIENMEGLSTEEKDSALLLITNLRVELAPIQEKVAAFTEETTKEEIRAAIKEMQDVADKARKLQRQLVGLMINAKLHQLIVKHEEFRNGMQSRIDTLKEAGADVQELESLLKRFDEQIAALKNDYAVAQNRWLEVNTTEDFDEFVRNLHKAQHFVRNDLTDTKQTLREFIQKYKEIKQTLEAAAGNATAEDEEIGEAAEEEQEEVEGNVTDEDAADEAAETPVETGEDQEQDEAEEENEADETEGNETGTNETVSA